MYVEGGGYIELKEMNENVHIQDMMYTSRSKRTVPYVPTWLKGALGKLKYGYESFFFKKTVCEDIAQRTRHNV